ncbi:MAG: VacB/RNase II family 3'-5' exoribonuclease [Saccharospirillum sp.]
MLDAKALAQLQSLKSDIKATQPVLTGTVKGTGRSFGFIISDIGGDEYFLPPESMSKVFPGDKVTFTVEQQSDGKVRAALETLESSTFTTFIGRYVVRGKAQGVEPEDASHGKWLFVPPKKAADAQSGQWVKATVSRHPWETGKAQAEVIEVLGSEGEPGTWHALAIEKYGLHKVFSDDIEAAAAQLTEAHIEALAPGRADMRDLAFVTIDSASTLDMDDALFAEEDDANGWLLRVAVADPSVWFEAGSALDQAARARLTTTYLPGLPLSMLPQRLANDLCSLVPERDRLALVFELRVEQDGRITRTEIRPALILSQGKLSYDEVSTWLDGGSPIPAQHWHLETLHACCQALRQWREANALVMQDQPDYRIWVDDTLAVTDVHREDKQTAHQVVEECMLATNREAANWLRSEPALFMTHPGFRADRGDELKGLLREAAPMVAEHDSYSLEGFRSIMRAARQHNDGPLHKVLQKRLERGAWSDRVKPHFGLGFEAYTTVTSPIRKYTDLTLHRLIHARLNGQADALPEGLVEELNERLVLSRRAANEVDNRLRLIWLAHQPQTGWAGKVVHINSGGLMVQLVDNGATGFVDLRSASPKFSHDPLRMVLKNDQQQFQLEQPVTVRIVKNDGQKLELGLE